MTQPLNHNSANEIYIVQNPDLIADAKAFFQKLQTEHAEFEDLDFKYTPDELYDRKRYELDIEQLYHHTHSLASITDPRGMKGFEMESVRILLRDDFFKPIDDVDPMDILFHEFGYYHTNLKTELEEIRCFSTENSPPFFYSSYPIEDFKMLDKLNYFNTGVNGLLNIFKLPQEIHAQLWVYNKNPDRFYSFMEWYFRYLDKLNTSYENEKEAPEHAYLLLPQYVFVIYWLEAVSKKVSSEFYETCLTYTSKVLKTLENLFSKGKFKGTDFLTLKSKILNAVEYEKENHSKLKELYISLFKEFIVKSASCFGSNFRIRIDLISYYGNYLRILTERLNLNNEIQHGSVWNAFDLPKREIESFKSIVLDAGEVSANSFDGLVLKNPMLCYYPSISNIKAVGALKVPNRTYKKRMFATAGYEEIIEHYDYELGWIVCIEEHRGQGIGRKVTELLCSVKNMGIYATVREKNTAMLGILKDLNFQKLGDPMDSKLTRRHAKWCNRRYCGG
jgi:ribosomal protein S18 acetylase RimI-like enzyme